MKRRSLREVSVTATQYDTEGWRADVRDIEVEARGLMDHFLAFDERRTDDLAAFGNPTEDDEMSAGVYLAAVFARVAEGVRQLAAELYERHGKQNVPVAGPNIVGDIYCVIDSTRGIPDPRAEEGCAPYLCITVHRKRVKWWMGEVQRLLALIIDLDAGRAADRPTLTGYCYSGTSTPTAPASPPQTAPTFRAPWRVDDDAPTSGEGEAS